MSACGSRPLEGSVSVVKGVVRAYKFGWEWQSIGYLYRRRVEKKGGKDK